ncbi:MAG: hypothetical protein HQK75_19500 [Candidatus Magnetomorum sp.]|nr:hypothetical protein [Candidatus Magnetomorum sp.]
MYYIFEIEDHTGIPVRLSHSVWNDKILAPSPKGHPEVEKYFEEAKQTIQNPDIVLESRQRKNVHLHYKIYNNDRDKKLFLTVVIKYLSETNKIIGYISTIYLTCKLMRGKLLWMHPSMKNLS